MGAYEGAGITWSAAASACPTTTRTSGARSTGAGTFPDGSRYLAAPTRLQRQSANTSQTPVRLRHQQLPVQSVAHRRRQHRQQLAGRRRHVHARLEPQPRDRQQPDLRPTTARCRAPSTSATARLRRSTPTTARSAATGVTRRRRCARRSERQPDRRRHAGDQCGDSVPVEREDARAPQHDRQQRLDRRRAVLRHAVRRRRHHDQCGCRQLPIDHNWIAGNLSTGDGGGLQHLGLTFNGRIDQQLDPVQPEHQSDIAHQRRRHCRSTARTRIARCPTATSAAPRPTSIARQASATAPGASLVIDANLIIGNSAESGSGGGRAPPAGQRRRSVIRVPGSLVRGRWYDVTVTNNVIANNVAGWDGGGVSMQDALKVTFVNNTVVSNDTTASAGVLFKTLGAINSSAPPPGCMPTPDPTQPQNPLCLLQDAPHGPQPAGLVTMANTPNLIDSLPADDHLPAGIQLRQCLGHAPNPYQRCCAGPVEAGLDERPVLAEPRVQRQCGRRQRQSGRSGQHEPHRHGPAVAAEPGRFDTAAEPGRHRRMSDRRELLGRRRARRLQRDRPQRRRDS